MIKQVRRSVLKLLSAAALVLLASNQALRAEEVSFKEHLTPVLKRQCALCHLTGSEAGGMALHPRAAYASLVGPQALALPDMARVSPGDPAHSYLIHKLRGTHLAVGGSGERMPLGQAALDDAALALFVAWVEQGAQNN